MLPNNGQQPKRQRWPTAAICTSARQRLGTRWPSTLRTRPQRRSSTQPQRLVANDCHLLASPCFTRPRRPLASEQAAGRDHSQNHRGQRQSPVLSALAQGRRSNTRLRLYDNRAPRHADRRLVEYPIELPPLHLRTRPVAPRHDTNIALTMACISTPRGTGQGPSVNHHPILHLDSADQSRHAD
jgi:hypothetical protein